MNLYYKTFPKEQGDMFYDVLKRCGIKVIYTPSEDGKYVRLTIDCAQQDLQAAWDLCKDEFDRFVNQ